jgi:hypothetical protein
MSAIVYIAPEPVSVPFVAEPVPLVIVMWLSFNPVTDVLNVSCMPVLVVVLLAPPTCAAEKVTLVGATATVTATLLLCGFIK